MGAALVGAGDVAESILHPGVYGEGDAPSPGLRRRSPLALSSPGRPLLFVFACWPRAVMVVIVVPVAERTLPAPVPPFNAAGAVGSAQNMPGPTPASTEAGLGGLAGAVPPLAGIDEEKDALPRSGVAGVPGNTLECEVDGGGPSWGEMVPRPAGSRRIVVEVPESPFLCFK